MIKAAWYATVMILVLVGSFAASTGNIAGTIWCCSCILIGLWFAKGGENNG